jgi:hypothetical protein
MVIANEVKQSQTFFLVVSSSKFQVQHSLFSMTGMCFYLQPHKLYKPHNLEPYKEYKGIYVLLFDVQYSQHSLFRIPSLLATKTSTV